MEYECPVPFNRLLLPPTRTVLVRFWTLIREVATASLCPPCHPDRNTPAGALLSFFGHRSPADETVREVLKNKPFACFVLPSVDWVRPRKALTGQHHMA